MNAENNLKDKAKTVVKHTQKVFLVYVFSIVFVYIAGSIMASQHIIEVDRNQLLLGSAIIIGAVIILFEIWVTVKARHEQKLA